MIQLPPIPQALPTTQADWERFFNVMQQWKKGLQAHTWQTPTFQNGWVNYGAPFEPAGYYMDAAGRVHLRGLVKSGTVGHTTPIFTLPYVPQYDILIPIVTNADVFGEVRIASGTVGSWGGPGAVAVWSGNNEWVSLAGISFDTTP